MNDPSQQSQANIQQQRRTDLRIPLLIQKVKLDTGKKVFFGYSKNISSSGMYIAATNPLSPGTLVNVEIPLPFAPGRTAICRCEVIWKRRYDKKSPYEPGMGLKFLDFPQELACELNEWIAQSEPH
ncbi:MAG: pilus assembly protein PilZ [Desulfuromonas sp.]|nr:MAG: pilus assembly protein PilZ [Desulfuromonas sp.]